MRQFNQSIETNPELPQMFELAEKDIKRIFITVLHMFKMFDRDGGDKTKKIILRINLMKDI